MTTFDVVNLGGGGGGIIIATVTTTIFIIIIIVIVVVVVVVVSYRRRGYAESERKTDRVRARGKEEEWDRESSGVEGRVRGGGEWPYGEIGRGFANGCQAERDAILIYGRTSSAVRNAPLRRGNALWESVRVGARDQIVAASFGLSDSRPCRLTLLLTRRFRSRRRCRVANVNAKNVVRVG